MTLVADTGPAEAGDAPETTAEAAAREVGAAGESAATDGGADSGRLPKAAAIAIPAELEADLRAERLGRTASAGDDAKPRPVGAKLLDYSAHAAMIVGLIGFAWTVSNHVVSHPAPAESARATIEPASKQAESKPDPVAIELAALKQENLRLAADLGGLRAQIGALQSAGSRTPAQVKSLQAAVDGLQSGLAAERSDAASQTAAINGRLDKLQHDLQRDAALTRPDRGAADLTTGSLPPQETRPAVAEAAPLPPAKPNVIKPDAAKPEIAKADKVEAGKDGDRTPVIAAYVVRDVARGVALIEGRRGMLEVVPGVSIPGAGIVKSIERRGKGWTVITTRGQLAYAAPLPTYRRDGGRDYYPSYRYDF